MPKYMVLWRLKAEELPKDPEDMKNVMGMIMASVGKDFKDGTLLDWGSFIDGQYGYGIRQMEALDLQKWLLSVNQFIEVINVQEAINFEDAQKNMQSVAEAMKAMRNE